MSPCVCLSASRPLNLSFRHGSLTYFAHRLPPSLHSSIPPSPFLSFLFLLSLVQFGDMRGLIATLDESGTLAANYLGTDPPTGSVVTPSLKEVPAIACL